MRRTPLPKRFIEDEGGYGSRILDGRDGYDCTDDDIRKLKKTLEMHFAKNKFKGDYYENWELLRTSISHNASGNASRCMSALTCSP